jgi:hypothetical protein
MLWQNIRLHWEQLGKSMEKVPILIFTFNEPCDITSHSGTNFDMEDMPITCICLVESEFI